MGSRWSPVRVHVVRSTRDVGLLPIAAALLHARGDPGIGAPDARIYSRWMKRISDGHVVSSDARDSNLLLWAHDADAVPADKAVIARARALRLPLFLHTESDNVRPSRPIPGRLFRSSAYASRMLPHESISTGCVPDLDAERTTEDHELARWERVPTVGFVGHVTSGLRSIGYLRSGFQHFHGFRLRDQALRSLERSPLIGTDFVRRRRNLGPPLAGVNQDESKQRMRREYVESVLRHPYSLCVRGAGNWSYRLFETLSAGRIPLLIDTDCGLPLERDFDWDAHLCRIPINRLQDAGHALSAFHRSLGPSGLEDIQRKNRRLWVERLEPGAFFEEAMRSTAGLFKPFPATRSRPAGRPSR